MDNPVTKTYVDLYKNVDAPKESDVSYAPPNK